MTNSTIEMIDDEPAYLDPTRTYWSYAECRHYLHRKTGQAVKDQTIYKYAFQGCYKKMPKRPMIDRATFMQWVGIGCPVKHAPKVAPRKAG